MTYRGLPSPCGVVGHSLISKAKRKPWKATKNTARMNALSNQMGKAMSIDLTKGMTKFKSRVNPESVYQAWLTGDYHKVIHTIKWENFNEDLDPAVQKIAAAHHGAWNIGEASLLSKVVLPAPQDNRLRWDIQNPRIREYIASRKAFNFTNLSKDSAENIQHWVSRSFSNALTPRQVAEGIKSKIGLLPAHSAAVDKYHSGLISSGMPISQASKLSGEYADRLLDYRANMIARTETRLATNQGQLTVWRQASDQGLIDRHSTGKRWITMGPDPCELCEPMDGQTVPLDSFWTLPDGTTTDCPPDDVHPHCFCGFDIVYDMDKDEDEDIDKAFNEGDHPRDDHGKFSSGGGGSSSKDTKFSNSEAQSLKNYKENGYHAINSRLRDADHPTVKTSTEIRPMTEKEKLSTDKEIKNIDHAMQKSSLKEDTTVYRGISDKEMHDNPESFHGKTVEEKGFMSTTTNPKGSFSPFEQHSVVMHIQAKKGSKGINMDRFEEGSTRGEKEVLFSRGSKIKITGSHKDGHTTHIYAELQG